MRNAVLLGAVGALSLAMACGGGDKANPTAPSSTGSVSGGNALADGTTLKATPPTPIAPANGSTLEGGSPTLSVGASSAKFVQGEVFAYRFQVLQGTTVVAEHRGSSTSWAVDAPLQNKTQYGWHARAEQGPYFGPWSDTWTFTTPEQPEGYIRGNELYDPLINGRTVGQPIGPVTFIPGVGAKLETLGSYIRYQLPQTLTGGEFSILVTNLAFNTEGGKSKVMAMSEGLSDITTNSRRFTIEKRGDPPGQVAWRVITSGSRIETVGGERRTVHFNTSHTYLWQANYGGGRFNLLIKDGGAHGNTIYSFGKGYAGVYDPSPQYVFVGGPAGRGGAGTGTVPDIIVRQVWLSPRPRPEFANK
jgi:hypothetical protein